ncbi:MAG: hypothetical protein HPY65_00800 [Syntrophaceae bacterium]|nr:hypothetical protein [Syntrophaceae bacterium]
MNAKPIKHLVFTIAVLLILSGCSVGLVTVKTVSQEKPFATAVMKGDVTEATRCIGRYWQKEADELGFYWHVFVYSYQVHVTGEVTGGSTIGPVSLIIEFSEKNGKTIAEARVHSMFDENNPRRIITMKALDACKAR